MNKQGMNSEIKKVEVLITDERQKKTSSGVIRVQFWGQQERTLRAMKFGGFCWIAAAVSILIPLLHFILVPALLIAGPALAFYVMSKESVVLEALM